ncbi:MAG: hypothetical protein KGD63_05200 [Candidatus Lokiarchaeota archaeon]|nr:hypothetical protein [Candidatus Lokiarchaeota archaeon]
MTRKFKSFLEKDEEISKLLNYPGVYRFIGFHQLTGNESYPLYVGKSGDTEGVWDYYHNKVSKSKQSQVLIGRILRHLNNDAGILNMIMDDYSMLKKIEFWYVDPRDFEINEFNLFKETIIYLEYYIKYEINETPYYNQIIKTQKKIIDPSKLILEKALKIFKNNKKEIDFPKDILSEREKIFHNYFKAITESPVRMLVKFRRYKKLENIMNGFFESWKNLEKEDFFWHRLDE